jgi:hypothetical protein
MALHQLIQRLLLIGANLDTPPAPPVPEPPQRLRALIDALAPAHREFDALAIRYGHRYRSGFWAIYLLSALAVLCAMMPLALGWDALESYMHNFAAAWVYAEILVIAAVALIYWRGHKGNWQGEWLHARTVAELTSYLPVVAPLIDLAKPGQEPDWYARGPSAAAGTPQELIALCRTHETPTRDALAGAWDDAHFVVTYAAWTIGILQAQQAYHARVARRMHVLQHRIHRVTAGLFALTAIGAVAHLFIHSRKISLITTVFPALAAALHGALAQSEAYRLESASVRVARELQKSVDEIREAANLEAGSARAARLRTAVGAALTLILQEHQDWYMLVRPHHLPLG